MKIAGPDFRIVLSAGLDFHIGVAEPQLTPNTAVISLYCNKPGCSWVEQWT